MGLPFFVCIDDFSKSEGLLCIAFLSMDCDFLAGLSVLLLLDPYD